MSAHLGLLGFLSEANEIKEELDVPFDEALAIQRERSDQRMAEYEASKIESNVIYGVDFRAKLDPEAA